MSKMKKKACIYVRVSTEHEEQDQSYNAQLNYFKEHYKEDYDIIKIYAEKESGTSIKKREEFKKMLKDSGLELEEKRGNINIYNTNKEPQFNYIITKSISRFARNIEIKEVIRKLDKQGVYIIFDDINRCTEDKEDSLLLGILLQMAEEESTNKSKIIKWGKKRSAENNVIPMNRPPYGYIADIENNRLIAEPKESEVVKLIFNLYVEGNGVRKIKQILTDKGIYNKEGKEFSENLILYIIQNPKYCGLNIRNRFIKTDIFNQNQQLELEENEWIALKNSRIDKIIDDEIFEKAQQELNSRRINGKGYRGFSKSKFANKIKCKCGGNYIHNTYYYPSGNVEYYVCNKKKKLGKVKSGCSSRNITQEELDNAIDTFISNYNMLFKEKIENILKQLNKKENKIVATDTSKIENKLSNINSLLNNNKFKTEKLIDMLLESSTTKEQLINKKLEEIESENKKLEAEKSELNNIINNKKGMLNNIQVFKNMLREIKKEELSTDRNNFIEGIAQIELDKDDNIKITTKIFIVLDTLLLTALEYNANNNYIVEFKKQLYSIIKKI